MSYIENLLRGKSEDYIDGFISGARAFAWWKEGEQEVGTTGRKLRNVINEAEWMKTQLAQKGKMNG